MHRNSTAGDFKFRSPLSIPVFKGQPCVSLALGLDKGTLGHNDIYLLNFSVWEG